MAAARYTAARPGNTSRTRVAPAESTLDAVAEEDVTIGHIAEVIGRHLDLPVVSVPPPRRQASPSAGWPASSRSTARSRALSLAVLGYEAATPTM